MKKCLDAVRSSSYLVAFSGAGMDTESHLPDFRGPEGLWKNHDPRTLASTRALYDNYSLFHEFYSYRIQCLKGARPHRGHEILADWERRGLLKAIITQNVSGLHREAGSANVIELHGNIRRIFCLECAREHHEDVFLDGGRCQCGGLLRPGVTLFGESLPSEAFYRADEELSKADMVLILGTSLEVYPAAQLPFMYPMKRAYVDLQAYADERIDFVIRQRIGAFLERALRYFEEES
ncbi:MAG: NAD-dependent protein deacylase [Tissierellia bacterium]|nr:Sir2 family NAD-dependent protein deacetylase [Bacillota bacterium]NLL23472.1 NAD-dependent protein deacylase [Tissierellia bacterium]